MTGDAVHRPSVAVITLVTDDVLYAASIGSVARAARSAGVGLEVQPVRCATHGWNAAQGLNHGIDMTRARWVLCVHQDVMLPVGWFHRAAAQIIGAGGGDGPFWADRPAADADADAAADLPAVIGTVGTTPSGRFVGSVLDPNGFCRWGRGPADVSSLDEHLILLDRASGLRFDPDVPGFHAYGTDLVLQARQAGRRAVAIDAPVVHASTGTIDEAWNTAADWIVERWSDRRDMVIPTPARTMRSGTGLGVRRATIALNRRLAVHGRNLRRIAGGRWAMPPATRNELIECIRGLPSTVRPRMPAAGIR